MGGSTTGGAFTWPGGLNVDSTVPGGFAWRFIP
jgi:hypothetical protein